MWAICSRYVGRFTSTTSCNSQKLKHDTARNTYLLIFLTALCSLKVFQRCLTKNMQWLLTEYWENCRNEMDVQRYMLFAKDCREDDCQCTECLMTCLSGFNKALQTLSTLPGSPISQSLENRYKAKNFAPIHSSALASVKLCHGIVTTLLHICKWSQVFQGNHRHSQILPAYLQAFLTNTFGLNLLMICVSEHRSWIRD